MFWSLREICVASDSSHVSRSNVFMTLISLVYAVFTPVCALYLAPFCFLPVYRLDALHCFKCNSIFPIDISYPQT